MFDKCVRPLQALNLVAGTHMAMCLKELSHNYIILYANVNAQVNN